MALPPPAIVAAAALFIILAAAPAASQSTGYNALFNFGDSITDTGNLCVNGIPSSITMTKPPYGMTYFHKVTCRCTDGRVVVDFLAQALGLPLLPPSKATGSNFQQGANMAIAGATAMDQSFFQALGIADKMWDSGPMNTQIQWFQQLAPAICGSSCGEYFANSLFVLGEFGGNDYNVQLFSGSSPEEASTYSPQIVGSISDGVEQLISVGATYIVVPAVLPIGCFPVYLTLFQSGDPSDYDEHGCLHRFNDLATYHNSLLQNQVTTLQAMYPNTRIMYADFFSHVYDMVANPANYGFVSGLQSCCGAGGGKYNYDNDRRCGMQGANACADPSKYVSWDGVHLTEAAYKHIANGWLRGPYAQPPILG